MHPPVSGRCWLPSVAIGVYYSADTILRTDKNISESRHRLYLLSTISWKWQALDNILIRFDSCPHKERPFVIYSRDNLKKSASYLLLLPFFSLLKSLPDCPISLWLHRGSFDTRSSLPHFASGISSHIHRDSSFRISLASLRTLSSSFPWHRLKAWWSCPWWSSSPAPPGSSACRSCADSRSDPAASACLGSASSWSCGPTGCQCRSSDCDSLPGLEACTDYRA